MSRANHKNYDAAALYHIPQRKTLDPETGLDVTLHKYGRRELINAVRDHGVDFHISRGKDAYDEPGSVNEVLVPHVDGDKDPTVTLLGKKSLSEYGAVRTISGPLSEVHIPALTDGTVRSIASDKFATNRLLHSLGLHEGSQLVEPTDNLAEILEAIPGYNVVLKPRYGLQSRGIIVATKKDALAAYETRDDKEADYILEEKLDFSVPFPNTIRGYEPESQSRLERANAEGANKEIRSIYFGNNDFAYIARAAAKEDKDFKTDDWVFLDPATIPQDIIDIDHKVVRAIEIESGINEFHIAIDKTYATTDSNNIPTWRVMEVNAGEPQLVRPRQHQVIAKEQTALLAGQIARIARKRTLQ